MRAARPAVMAGRSRRSRSRRLEAKRADHAGIEPTHDRQGAGQRCRPGDDRSGGRRRTGREDRGAGDRRRGATRRRMARAASYLPHERARYPLVRARSGRRDRSRSGLGRPHCRAKGGLSRRCPHGGDDSGVARSGGWGAAPNWAGDADRERVRAGALRGDRIGEPARRGVGLRSRGLRGVSPHATGRDRDARSWDTTIPDTAGITRCSASWWRRARPGCAPSTDRSPIFGITTGSAAPASRRGRSVTTASGASTPIRSRLPTRSSPPTKPSLPGREEVLAANAEAEQARARARSP